MAYRSRRSKLVRRAKRLADKQVKKDAVVEFVEAASTIFAFTIMVATMLVMATVVSTSFQTSFKDDSGE